MTVSIDDGFVRDWINKKRHFEVIVGRSAPWEGDAKRFGFVYGQDEKPKRRLFELLQSQGMQMNQQITFVSDGADNVRDLQFYLNPHAEHILDWFHLTILDQHAKGAARLDESNAGMIPNYGGRRRYGEAISTATAESTVNAVVNKRFCKKQQMQWSKEGAHLLLQNRTRTLNRELADTFRRWYPDLTCGEGEKGEELYQAAAYSRVRSLSKALALRRSKASGSKWRPRICRTCRRSV